MIFFLLCRAGNHTIRNSYLYDFPGMRGRVQVVNYEGAMQQPVIPRGCYVFTDVDRAPPDLMRGINAFHEFLGTLGPSVRCINHPTLSMQRYELLRTLYERGINDFDIYRASEGRRPLRYPVFLRRENDHDGPLSYLLKGPAGEILAMILNTIHNLRFYLNFFSDMRKSIGEGTFGGFKQKWEAILL